MPSRPPPRRTPLAASLLLALTVPLPSRGADLPAGPSVVRGQARIATSGSAMTVTTGARAAIDWQSFSIGAGASVHFQQPDAASQVLNRVRGAEPSQIWGRLSSNGEVWLLNPHGVLFGRSARVDVGGLVASTLSLDLADWAAGRRRLDAAAGPGGAEVVNAGHLRSAVGGRILLVGRHAVSNTGIVDAPGGRAGLLAGQSVDLADSTRPDIAVRVPADASGVTNRGLISASAGTVDLQAAMVNQAGVVRADSVSEGPGGRVLLRAGDRLLAAPGSITSATAQGGDARGGRIETLGGTQEISGAIEVGAAAGRGGEVVMAGPRVALLDGASIGAEGARGGGSIRVGLPHDAGAVGAAGVPAAEAVFVDRGASLTVDARESGHGGSIHLWSTGATRAFGRFSARGGPLGGDGGRVDTSGLGLDARPAAVDTSAPQGRRGEWLLDPIDVRIVPAVEGTSGVDPESRYEPIAAGAQVDVQTLAAALVASDVTITTGAGGGQAGLISMTGTTLLAPLPEFPLSSTTIVTEHTLTLQAAAGVQLTNARIESPSGRLHVRMIGGSEPGQGVSLTGSTVSTRGDVTLRGQTVATSGSDVAGRTVTVEGDVVGLGTRVGPDNTRVGSTLRGGTGPDALVVRGLSGPVRTFLNGSGSAALSTATGGRWLLYAEDPATSQVGALAYGFKQYAAPPGAAVPATGNGLLYAIAPVLGVAAPGLVLDKTYDGGTSVSASAAQVAAVALTGFLGADRPVLPGTAETRTTGWVDALRYDSRNAGDAVPVTASLGPLGLPPITDAGRPVTGYTFDGAGLTGRIAPAPVELGAATVADKVYDGNASAVVLATRLAGVMPGDAVSAGGVDGRFAGPAAGAARPVTVTAAGLTGPDSANYLLRQATTLTTASITPAPLSYRASPATMVAGGALPALTGRVEGFVGGETLATATTGSLSFNAPGGVGGRPGLFAVEGAGLAAANYAFTQDPGNATALAVLAPDRSQAARHPMPWRLPEVSRETRTTLTSVPPPTAIGFAPLDTDLMPAWKIRQDMRAFGAGIDWTFRSARAQLEADAGLARLPDCTDLGGAMLGECVITPELKQLLSVNWGPRTAWPDRWAMLDVDARFEDLFWLPVQLLQPRPGPNPFVLGDGQLLRLDSAGLASGDKLDAARRLGGLLADAGKTLAPFPSSVGPSAIGGTGSQTTSARIGGEPAGGPAAAVEPGRPPSAGGGASPVAGDGSPTVASATAPPAVIVAARPSEELSLQLSPPASGPMTAASCATPQQRQSGECQRQAELDALRDAAQRCAQFPREQQPSCLFSERVKFQLRQREQDARLISLTLQAREARRATLPDIRRKWALVIGVEQYPKVLLGGQPVRMAAAGNDARALGQELRRRFGYITSELLNPTRAEVVQRLNMLAAVAQPQDSLLVFFSGYGFSLAQGDEAVWALADADPQDGRTVLAHTDLVRLLNLIDARQVALVSDSSLAGRLRVRPVDYDPKAAPDASGLLGRRAVVALTSGGNLPLATVQGQGLSDFGAQLLRVLRRIDTWHIGGRVFREVQAPLIQAGRPFVPQYGAASLTQHDARADYLFERRELDAAVAPGR